MNNIKKSDSDVEDNADEFSIPEISLMDPEDNLPVINIVVNPDDPQNLNNLATNVPLFIKKLWKIVNDVKNEQIISWNKNGDGFVIHDQLRFISETLPKYFKHNQLSSFVRQLNLYDFHKTQPLEKEDFQFSNAFFLKDLPQLLPLIKRKSPGPSRQKVTGNNNKKAPEPELQNNVVQELLNNIQDIKDTSESISTDMSKLKQENAALWNEVNSLRCKYSKQTKIINKLIHFLIAYMQKHHNSRKSGRTVSAANSNKYLKTGPKIMELDYRYKNNPHEFWSDFDNSQQVSNINEQDAYTVVEPSDNHQKPEPEVQEPNMRVSSNIEEIFSNQIEDQNLSEFDYSKSMPSSSTNTATSSALQRSGNSGKENMGYLIDNSRVEMNTLKELLKNLSPDDMSSFYKLINDNYKIQDEDLTADSENELRALNQLSPQVPEVNASESGESISAFNPAHDGEPVDRTASMSPLYKYTSGDTTSAMPFDDIILVENNTDRPDLQLTNDEPDLGLTNDEPDLGLTNDELLNSDILNVDQFLDIN
ncbi:hypothetical protein ABEB36_008178 [Hypothenemus hampei]|uniref:HSF-type DNA-binding domain-containing protein n=1 Tax=Hypothenemus hampei TaxID=57062 RepID=A0ABD1EL43_HYPHA